MSLRVFLLAAGFGSRLRPLTDTVPKCAVPINEKPLLNYWYEQLKVLNVDLFLVNTHYLPDVVGSIIRRLPSASLDRTRVIFEPHLLGTAGSILSNIDVLLPADTVLIAHADNLCICDFQEFLAAHYRRPAGCVMTMMLFECDDPQKCGIVEVDDSGIVVEFHEKVSDPPSRMANGAVYLVDSCFLNWLNENYNVESSPDLSIDVIPDLLGRIYSWANDGYHRDIGTPESYQQACSDMRLLYQDD